MTVAVRVSPQHTLALAPVILDAGVDILVIQGTIVSAEHVSTVDEPLNLKEFIADLDLPVVVGGCTNYQTALHLMRTGAAGVIVGVGADEWSTTDMVLGIRVPMATAIADAAAARRDYLDETGGRYVHLIADGDVRTSGDIAKALGCGADAVMLGEPLSMCEEAPAGGAWWHSAASHPKLPRGAFGPAGEPLGSMERLLFGPSDDPDGGLNLFGGLRRAMAKSGVPRPQGVPEGRPGARPLTGCPPPRAGPARPATGLTPGSRPARRAACAGRVPPVPRWTARRAPGRYRRSRPAAATAPPAVPAPPPEPALSACPAR